MPRMPFADSEKPVDSFKSVAAITTGAQVSLLNAKA
jgi:hypothetical protein